MIQINTHLKKLSQQFSDVIHWDSKIKDRFGLSVQADAGVYNYGELLQEIFNILRPIPAGVVKDCGINVLLLKTDMGPNKPFYPNHGYFINHLVALNADMFYHPDQPDDFIDHRGYFLTRAQQTLVHEFGHGYDEYHDTLSLKPARLKLSGWSETPKKGLKQMVIRDQGTPEKRGEWYYDPSAGFTRFYAKMNPWDDYADCFAFYIGGLRNKIPAEKNAYFDTLLQKYYV
jgi:hypothetical protein